MGTQWGPKRSVYDVYVMHVCCLSLASFVLDGGGESAVKLPLSEGPWLLLRLFSLGPALAQIWYP